MGGGDKRRGWTGGWEDRDGWVSMGMQVKCSGEDEGDVRVLVGV